MKEFYTPCEAANWLSGQTGETLSDRDILEWAADGRLSVCFYYRGTLGYFPPPPEISADGAVPVAGLFPLPAARFYFDGWLQSETHCALDMPVRNLLRGTVRREHRLTPRRVRVIKARWVHPPLEAVATPAGGYLARVNDNSPSGLYGYRDDSPAPLADWRFHRDALTNLLRVQAEAEAQQASLAAQRRQAAYGRQGAQAKTERGPQAQRNERIRARNQELRLAGHHEIVATLMAQFHLSKSQIHRIIK